MSFACSWETEITMNAKRSATRTIRADIALCAMPRAIFDLRFGIPCEYPCELDMTMLIGLHDCERNSRHGFWKA